MIIKKYRETGIRKLGNQGPGSSFGWEKQKIGYLGFGT
jgi:hypothetical protein